MIARLLGRFGRDRRANVAMITALCAVPLVAMVGFAIDYGTALSNKAKLDQATDAAAMVAITTAKNLANNQGGSLTTPVDVLAAGQAAGLQAFAANAGRLAFASVPTPTVTVTQGAGQKIQAVVSYSAVGTQTNFSSLIGLKTIPVSGSATASLVTGTYLDFYLLIDMSGSMGLPTSSSGQSQLAAVNPDLLSSFPGGCMFACHFSGYQGYDVTRQYNIPLRVDSVESAVCSLFTTAIATESMTGLTGQFRVGIYPFIQNVEAFWPLDTNLTKGINAVTGQSSGTCPSTMTSTGLVTRLDQGLDATPSNPLGSGGTNFANAMTPRGSGYGIGGYITTLGNGSTSSNSKPYVFLITDGMNNSQTYTQEQGFQGGSNPTPFYSQAACDALKNQGVTISILYIPYLNIPANTNAAPWAQAEDQQANNQTNLLAPALSACASTGFFYTANSAADITNALNAMFQQAVQVAQLTK
jgi:Flp pilus assembly protein TadG